jgi:SIR2-like protein
VRSRAGAMASSRQLTSAGRGNDDTTGAAEIGELGGEESRRKWDDRVWDTLVEQLRNGDCTPFLGAGACYGTLPLGSEVAQDMATTYDYPFDDPWNLPAVAQYAGVTVEDLVTIKQRVARQYRVGSEPPFEKPTEPHSLLADLPLKVYLTTNYDDYMTRALVRAGKEPLTAICPWYRGAEVDPGMSLPAAYQPAPGRPLVYHLHGSFQQPASMVLAEQDYVEFLVNLSRDIGEDMPRLLPIPVLLAMTRQPLLFVGYSLHDWSFRMLFHGLVGAVPAVQQRRHISVQLTPGVGMSDPGARRRAEEYLTRYFAKLNITVYWGSAEEFCTELGHRLGRLESA